MLRYNQVKENEVNQINSKGEQRNELHNSSIRGFSRESDNRVL